MRFANASRSAAAIAPTVASALRRPRGAREGRRKPPQATCPARVSVHEAGEAAGCGRIDGVRCQRGFVSTSLTCFAAALRRLGTYRTRRGCPRRTCAWRGCSLEVEDVCSSSMAVRKPGRRPAGTMLRRTKISESSVLGFTSHASMLGFTWIFIAGEGEGRAQNRQERRVEIGQCR